MTTATLIDPAPVTAPAPPPGNLTLGQAAAALGLRDWQLARIFRRRLVPEPARLGRMRMIAVSDLPALRRVAEKVGYLSPTPAANGEAPAA
jgi:hypothetical protein